MYLYLEHLFPLIHIIQIIQSNVMNNYLTPGNKMTPYYMIPFYEMSGIGKYTETESRLVLA